MANVLASSVLLQRTLQTATPLIFGAALAAWGAGHLVDGGGRVGRDTRAVLGQTELSLRAAIQLASAMTPAVARHSGKPPN